MNTITLYPRSKTPFSQNGIPSLTLQVKIMKLNIFILLYILCWCKVQPVDFAKYHLEWATTNFVCGRFSS